MFSKNPIDLINHNRFDLPIKYLYAKSYLKNLETNYFLEMYKHHIKIWNNYKEYNNPQKNTFEAFKTIFEEIIDSINESGFDEKKGLVPLKDNKFVLNGAHRVSSCLATNREVGCKNGRDGRDGQFNCGWKFFKGLGIDSGYADRCALEYAKLKSNTHIVTMFPSATSRGGLDKVEKILNDHTNVFYKKSVKLNKTGAFNLMRELYLGETWAGTHPKYGGFNAKATLCYKTSGPTIVYLCEFSDLNQTKKVKQLIRKIYNIGNHSVHINDTHSETTRIGKLFFNENSIHHLNNTKTVNYTKFTKLLNQFKEHIEKNNYNLDDYCVTASGSLSAYGLREGNDLDYLHYGDKKINGVKDISSHNSYGKGRYGKKYDDIIFNPSNHFYYRGVKFASLGVVKKLKEKRGEDKDKVDISLLDTVI